MAVDDATDSRYADGSPSSFCCGTIRRAPLRQEGRPSLRDNDGMFLTDPEHDCAWCGLAERGPVHDRDLSLTSHPFRPPPPDLVALRLTLVPGVHEPEYFLPGSPFRDEGCGPQNVLLLQGYPMVARCPLSASGHEGEMVGWRLMFNVAWAEPFLAGWLGGCGCQLFVSAWALLVVPGEPEQYASFVQVSPDSFL